MPAPEILDFAALLAPIAGGNPAGEDLRADPSPASPYYAVKDARSAARAAERQLLLDAEDSAAPDWRPVLQHSCRALAEKSKDLEVAVYLIEALVRLHGFAGLRDGFRLACRLVEDYWDGLHPLPDEDGLETRLAPLAGLNGGEAEGTLINPIALVPLTQGSSVGPFAQVHYQRAQAVGRLPDEAARRQRVEQGGLLPQTFERAVAETPAAFFVTLVEDLTQCREEFARLCALLDEKCGGQSPPSSQIRAALTACLDTVNATAREKLLAAAANGQAAAETEGATATVQANGVPQAAAGAVRDREQALRTLLDLSEFFRRTEPHTPVSYALEQAVRWGRMSLPELLTELIPDDAPRMTFFKHVGIRPAPIGDNG